MNHETTTKGDNMTAPFVYQVQMQTATGEIVEARYAVRWDPEKWGGENVAIACAAEHTVAAGFTSDHMPKKKHVGLTAVLQPQDDSLTS